MKIRKGKDWKNLHT